MDLDRSGKLRNASQIVMMNISSVFLGLPSAKIHLYPFSHKNIHFSQVAMRFLTPTDIHIFFLHFLIKKTPKIGIQGNNLHILILNLNFKKKIFSKSENLKNLVGLKI